MKETGGAERQQKLASCIIGYFKRRVFPERGSVVSGTESAVWFSKACLVDLQIGNVSELRTRDGGGVVGWRPARVGEE